MTATLAKLKQPNAVKVIYDNGGKSLDRFTIVYNTNRISIGSPKVKRWECFSSSYNPFHSQGVFQHGECVLGAHLGKEIQFSQLPRRVQKAVIADCD